MANKIKKQSLKKAKKQFLKRPYRFMFRFNKKELREFFGRADRSGLSRVEYGRRKILDQPVVELVENSPVQSPAEIAAV